MAIIVKVNRKTKPGAVQKALKKLAKKNIKADRKTIADFYGALPKVYGDGLKFQKKLRDEW